MKKKEIKLFDQNQWDMALSIQSKLLETFDKVEMACPGIGNRTKSHRAITVNVYEKNKYDFKEISVRYLEAADLREYLSFILYCLQDEKCYKRKIASLEKRFIVDLSESNNCMNFCIYGNELLSVKSKESIWLNDIEEFHYSKIDKKMTIILLSDEKYEIDFTSETIDFMGEVDDELL